MDISFCRSWGASVCLQVPLVHASSPSQSPSYFRGEGILHVPPKPPVPVLANGLSRLPPSLGTSCSSSLLCLCLPFIPLHPHAYKRVQALPTSRFRLLPSRMSPLFHRGGPSHRCPLSSAVLPDRWNSGFCPHHMIELSQQRPSVTSNPMSS